MRAENARQQSIRHDGMPCSSWLRKWDIFPDNAQGGVDKCRRLLYNHNYDKDNNNNNEGKENDFQDS